MLCMLGLLPWPLLCTSCLLLIRLALGCSWHTSICWLGSPLLCHLMLASLKDVYIRSPRGRRTLRAMTFRTTILPGPDILSDYLTHYSAIDGCIVAVAVDDGLVQPPGIAAHHPPGIRHKSTKRKSSRKSGPALTTQVGGWYSSRVWKGFWGSNWM